MRVVRLDYKDTLARAGHELRWGEVRGYLVNPSLPVGITFLAVKIRATDSLSMRSSRLVNCLVTRKLPVWNPCSGWSPPQATRSIAWAFADAVRADYGANSLIAASTWPPCAGWTRLGLHGETSSTPSSTRKSPSGRLRINLQSSR